VPFRLSRLDEDLEDLPAELDTTPGRAQINNRLWAEIRAVLEPAFAQDKQIELRWVPEDNQLRLRRIDPVNGDVTLVLFVEQF
jgi:hypothetical protein